MMTEKRQRPREAAVGVAANLGGLCREKYTKHDAELQRRLDDERERRINTLRLELLAATEPEKRRTSWNALRDEIAKRSTAAVERLERARGLFPLQCGQGVY